MLKFTNGQPNMIDFLYVNHIWLTIVKSTKDGGFIKKQDGWISCNIKLLIKKVNNAPLALIISFICERFFTPERLAD
ncbi:MAG TPA: hypothetical protein PLJ90_01955 [Candidatus Cloacimonas sp.]|nr:hypothetical protein [Candidatus Cloacimonas sp.]